jgi:hypothetical protein
LIGGDSAIGSTDSPRQPDVMVLVTCGIDRVRQRGDQRFGQSQPEPNEHDWDHAQEMVMVSWLRNL